MNLIHKLIFSHREESKETTVKSKDEAPKKLEPGTCLDSATVDGGHSCDGRSCVRIRAFQRKNLATWFDAVTEKEKSEVQILADCYARTTVKLGTALEFYSRMCTLGRLKR